MHLVPLFSLVSDPLPLLCNIAGRFVLWCSLVCTMGVWDGDGQPQVLPAPQKMCMLSVLFYCRTSETFQIQIGEKPTNSCGRSRTHQGCLQKMWKTPNRRQLSTSQFRYALNLNSRFQNCTKEFPSTAHIKCAKSITNFCAINISMGNISFLPDLSACCTV